MGYLLAQQLVATGEHVVNMTDEQRADSVGAFGNPAARTPNSTRSPLTVRGVQPSVGGSGACSQSRMSMMTGWYPHVAGHRTLDNLLQPWEPNVLAISAAARLPRGLGGRPRATPSLRGHRGVDGLLRLHASSRRLEADRVGCTSALPDRARSGARPPIGKLKGEELLTLDEARCRPPSSCSPTACRNLGAVPRADRAPPALRHGGAVVLAPLDTRDMPTPAPSVRVRPGFIGGDPRRRRASTQLGAEDWAEISAIYYGMVSRLDEAVGVVEAALEQSGVLGSDGDVLLHRSRRVPRRLRLVEKWPSGLDAACSATR